MTTTIVPASVGSVIVSDPNVIVLMKLPGELPGDIVELIDVSDSSVVARAVKVGANWSASFTLTPAVAATIVLTARVKRGLTFSRLTTPTFKIVYEPDQVIINDILNYANDYGILINPVFVRSFGLSGVVGGLDASMQYKLDYILQYVNTSGNTIDFLETTIDPTSVINGNYSYTMLDAFTIPQDAAGGVANVYIKVKARQLGSTGNLIFVRDTIKIPCTISVSTPAPYGTPPPYGTPAPTNTPGNTSTPAPTPAPSMNIFLDNFTGTGTLASHTSDSGNTYVDFNTSYPSVSLSLSNGLLVTSAGSGATNYSGGAETTLTLPDTFSMEAIVNIGTITANGYVYFDFDFGLAHLDIQVDNTSIYPSLGSSTSTAGALSAPYAPGIFTFRLDVTPTTREWFIDNVSIRSSVTTESMAGTKFGFRLDTASPEAVFQLDSLRIYTNSSSSATPIPTSAPTPAPTAVP